MSHSSFPQSLPITSSMDIEDGHSTVTLSRELIYHIIGYLRGYPETMKACALTCKEWLPIVRIHFYHSIRFNHDALGKADRVARRFCELLDREPDFAQLIRELSIHWSAMFASSLIQRVDFTRLTSLEKVSLNFIPWSQAPLQTIRTIQLLFTLPSLTNLVLYSHVFKNITQFATLFDECRLNLKTLTLDHIAFIEAENLEACMQNFDNIHRPRVQLQSLELLHGSLGCIIPWLLHAHSPIDLSTLESLSCVDGGQNIPMLRKLFGAVGSVLKFLEIRSPSKLIDADDIDISPAILPNLVHLTITNIHLKSLGSAIVLLSQLQSSNRIEQIVLVIHPMDDVSTDSEDTGWERLDENLDGLQLMTLKSVRVVAKRKFMTDQERKLAAQMLEPRFRRMALRSIFRLL